MNVDDPKTTLLTGRFVFIVAVALCYFVAMGMLLPTLPRYVEDELGGNSVTVGVVVGSYALVAAVLRTTAGRLGDSRGRGALVVGGAAIVGVTVLLFNVFASITGFVVLRLIGGLGEAGVFVGAATAAQDQAPDERRGEAASYFSIAVYSGLAFGPLLGEWLYRTWGPSAVWTTAAAAFFVTALGGLRFGDSPTAGVGVSSAPRRRCFLQPDAVLPGVVQLLALFPFAAFTAFGALFADDMGLAGSGGLFLMYGLTVIVVRVAFASLPDRLGPIRTSSGALVLILLAAVMMGTASAGWVLYPAAIVFGLGMSLLFPGLFTIVVNNAPVAERSHAVGTFALFFDLSQALGPPILGIAVALAGGSNRAAFMVGAAVGVLGLVVVRTRLRQQVEDTTGA